MIEWLLRLVWCRRRRRHHHRYLIIGDNGGLMDIPSDKPLALKVAIADKFGNPIGAPPVGTTVSWASDNPPVLVAVVDGADTTHATATPVGPLGASNATAVVTEPGGSPIATPAFPLTVVPGSPSSAVIVTA